MASATVPTPPTGRRRAARALEAASQEKLRRLEAVTDAALSGLSLDDLLAELLERTCDLLAVDTAAILLLDPTGSELIATASYGLEDEVRHGVRVPVGEGFSGRIAAERQPIIIDHVDDTTVVSRFLIDKHLASMAGVPMLVEGRLIGVLHVGAEAARAFTVDDVDLLRLVADRASLATQARLSQLDRASTLALQRSLLPERLPAFDGLDVAARYIPGAAVGVGGDWYDLFSLPSGHIGVVIGDVAGNGLRAAVVMGRIRSALRAYALESIDPADVLTRLDRKIQIFEPDAMATAIYAVIDPDHHTMTMSSAGHLPPMVIRPSGATELVSAGPDLPLGAYPDAPRHAVIRTLSAGEAMVFYTDGLVERRDQSVRDGIEGLRAIVRPGPANVICVSAAELIGDVPTTDDVALLVLRRLVQQPPIAS